MLLVHQSQAGSQMMVASCVPRRFGFLTEISMATLGTEVKHLHTLTGTMEILARRGSKVIVTDFRVVELWEEGRWIEIFGKYIYLLFLPVIMSLNI